MTLDQPSSRSAHRLPRAAQSRAAGSAYDEDPTGELIPAYEQLGPYRLVSKLGEGGMGVVHLGLDRTGHEVAIKVLRAHVAHDDAARERLRREVDTLSRVRSDCVAEVLDADVDGDRPYLVTRYVPGPPLDDVITDRGAFDAEQLAALGHGLAEALSAIHDAGVVHRDVKPGNVLMLHGEPVLIDFGIAHVADDVRLTMTGLVMGTPGYLSPEIVEGERVSTATDWWGWAATLAYAASGQPPFGRGPMAVVLDRVTRGEADLAGVHPRMRPLLAAALAPNPAERPTSDQVLEQLGRFASGGQTTMVPQAKSATEYLPQAKPATEYVPQVKPATEYVPQAKPATEYVPQAKPATEYVPVADPTAQIPAQPADFYRQPPPSPGGSTPLPDEQGVRDPRIGRATRTGTIAALTAALVGLSALLPFVAVLLLLLWSLAARASDRTVTSMVLRRYAAGGARKSDSVVATMSSPWHVVLAALSAVLTALVPLFVGACAAATTALAVALAGNHSAQFARPLPVAVGVLVACWVMWWGPGGTSLRRGSRSIVRGLVRGEQLTRIVVAVLLAFAIGTVGYALMRSGQDVSWFPFHDRALDTTGWLPSLPGN